MGGLFWELALPRWCWRGVFVAALSTVFVLFHPPLEAGTMVYLDPTGQHTQSFEVLASEPWNHTGLQVKKGEKYQVRVVIIDPIKDASIHSPTIEGFPGDGWMSAKWATALRRCPDQNWMRLMGVVGKDDVKKNAVPMMENGRFTAPMDGELLLFFNDWRIMYWNNSGKVRLDITKES